MKKFAAIATVTMLALNTPALAASAAGTVELGSYASWTLNDLGAGSISTKALTADGTFSFDVLNAPGGTFTVTKNADDGLVSEIDTAKTEYLSAETPFGAEFGPSGSSKNIEFLKTPVDGSITGSTTEITFNSPMPAGVLGIAFTDLDYDSVALDVISGSGSSIAGSNLNGDTFNFCNVTTSVPKDCGAVDDVPTWNAGSETFVARDLNDSDGATGTIVPSESVKSLTVTHTTSAYSSYRTWMAVKTGKICGTVSGLSGKSAEVSLSFDGATLATIATSADGSYCLPKALAVAGYSLSVKGPADMSVSGGSSRDVSLANGDTTENFEVVLPITGFNGHFMQYSILLISAGFVVLVLNRKRRIA